MANELVVRQSSSYNREAEMVSLLRDLLNNPAFTTITGCCIIELLQRVIILKEPAEGAHWHWEVPNFGFQPEKPAKDVALLSQELGTAIEVGLIINLAGQGIKDIGSVIGSVGGLSGIAGLLGKAS